MGVKADTTADLVVIGGGIKGTAIARDAVGRGLRVLLCEQSDLGQSATKCFARIGLSLGKAPPRSRAGRHRKLTEQQILQRILPHITGCPSTLAQPKRWFQRAAPEPIGATLPLLTDTSHRLILLNARDAAERGAKILPQTRVAQVVRQDDSWKLSLKTNTTDYIETIGCQILVDTTADDSIYETNLVPTPDVTHVLSRLALIHRTPADKDFIHYNDAGTKRYFTVPYGQSFRLIGVLTKFKGSTEVASIVQGSDHLLDYANRVLPDISTDSKILWESDAKLSLRADVCPDKKPDDFLFTHDYANSGAPLFRVIGGSAATGRRLAEKVVAEMAPYASLIGKNWTRTARLPGGDFQAAIGPELLSDLQQKYPFIDTKQTQRLFAAYGTDASAILNGAKSAKALGQDFGNGLFESEVRWLLQREWAKTAEDIIWRRSMLGLEFSQSQIDALNNWIAVNHDS